MTPRDPVGSATIHPDDSDQPHVAINVDGTCVTATIDHLADSGQLPRHALETIRSQAIGLLEDVVASYAGRVAQGEVGIGGTAKATTAPPSAGTAPTGLLYGRVQSGKTAAMQIASAMAFDNGFRVIVVLTSNNVKLVEQTAGRFDDLKGPSTYSSLGGGADRYQWEKDEDHIRRWAPENGVVFVCAKEDNHLKSLISLLQKVGAHQWPALIMDDEADHATPDTNQAKRSGGRPLTSYSTTFRLVVENDQEPGFSLREALPHNVFLQITATPYALLLQNLTNPLKPAFTRLLEPGEGYSGGEYFFAQADDKAASPPLVYVDEGEAATLDKPKADAPKGLREAITLFVLSGAAHRLLHGSPPPSGYNFLCHTSAQQAKHKALSDMIRSFIGELTTLFREKPELAAIMPEVQVAIDELRRTIRELPDPRALIAEAGHYLPSRKLLVVNSADGAKLPAGGRFNFIVGGNILGRGLTISDLLVTYYLRQARISQMDTMHQHARMYGYRKTLRPYTRVYLPPSLASRFRKIHESEESLRNLLTGRSGVMSVPVEIAGNLRATRTNVLDVGAIAAYRPGQQVYPVEPVHNPSLLGSTVRDIQARLASAVESPLVDKTFYKVSINTMIDIVLLVKVINDDEEWNRNAIVNVLTTLRDRHEKEYNKMGYLFIRDFVPSRTRLPSGALSGEEQARARQLKAPVLFLFRGRKGAPWDADIIYPSIVFPEDMPTMVFNWDSDPQGASDVV